MRAGPQDLPTSRTLLIYTVASYFVASFFLAIFLLPLGEAIFAAVVDATILVLFSYVLLWVKLMLQRWYQTLTAMAGAGLIIAVLALPMYVARYMFGPESALAIILSFLILGLLVWSLAIFAHILRHTLDVPFIIAIFISGLYTYVTMRIIDILFFTAEIGAVSPT